MDFVSPKRVVDVELIGKGWQATAGMKRERLTTQPHFLVKYFLSGFIINRSIFSCWDGIFFVDPIKLGTLNLNRW